MQKPEAKWYNFLFVFRRLLITLACIFFRDNLVLQFAFLTYGTLGTIAFNLHAKPFSDHRMNKIENLNDITILVCCYFLHLFMEPDS